MQENNNIEDHGFDITGADDLAPSEDQKAENEESGAIEDNKEVEAEQEIKEEDSPEDKKEEETKEVTKKPTRGERRIKKLADEKKRLAEENERLRLELEAKQKEKLEEPNIDDFEDYEDFKTAKEEYEAKKAELQEEQTTQKADEPKYDVDELNEIVSDGAEVYDDFEEVITNEKAPFTEDVLAGIVELDKPEEVLYYLGKDIDTLSRIADLTPRKIAIELGKIEARIASGSGSKSKKKTEAPEPISPVDGGSTREPDLYDKNLSFEEYEAIVNKSRSNNNLGFL